MMLKSNKSLHFSQLLISFRPGLSSFLAATNWTSGQCP
jgi:hypothetical protein